MTSNMTWAKPRISAVILTCGRIDDLERCVFSLISSSENAGLQLDILVGWNTQTPRPPLGIDTVVRWYDFPESRLPGEARNALVQNVGGDWVFFIDDDAWVDPLFFSRFLRTVADKPDTQILGGPNLTPENSSNFENLTGLLLASPLVVANVSTRYKRTGHVRRATQSSLILCNLFVRSDLIRTPPFPPRFYCCEENFFIDQAQERGCEILYDPELYVWHRRRPTTLLFLKQIYRYGVGRGQHLKNTPRTLEWTHILAPLPLIALLVSLITLFAGQPLILAYFLLFYGAFCLASGLLASRKSEVLSIRMLSPAVIPMIHFSYAAGVIAGGLRK